MSEPPLSPSSPANRFERHPRLTLLGVAVVLLVFMDLVLRVAAQQGWVQVDHYRESQQPMYLDEINRDFGIWHHPGITYRQELSCVSPTYRTNAFGMRDRERRLQADGPRVVVLGDSFVEGVGVDDGDRFTNLLERELGREFMNFASTGFSPVQEWLVYQTLASRFEHDEVWLFMYPNNDFIEIDPAIRGGEYRPFLRREGEGYAIYYTVPFNENGRTDDYPLTKLINNHIANRWYLYNLGRQWVRRLKRSNYVSEIPTGTIPYRHADLSRWDQVRYAYQRLAELAGERPVRIFMIPSAPDALAMSREGYGFPIVAKVAELEGMSPNLKVYDLLPYFERYRQEHDLDPLEFYIPCDGHWSVLGHQVAARAAVHHAWGPGAGETIGWQQRNLVK